MTYTNCVSVYIMHSVHEENVHNDTEFVEKLVDGFGWQKLITRSSCLQILFSSK